MRTREVERKGGVDEFAEFGAGCSQEKAFGDQVHTFTTSG